MMTLHDPARWRQLPLAHQLGNIGSEVSRYASWQARGDRARQDQAMERALELLDAIIADPRWRYRLRELTRLREICCDLYTGGNMYDVGAPRLVEYFLPFALAVRQ